MFEEPEELSSEKLYALLIAILGKIGPVEINQADISETLDSFLCAETGEEGQLTLYIGGPSTGENNV